MPDTADVLKENVSVHSRSAFWCKLVSSLIRTNIDIDIQRANNLNNNNNNNNSNNKPKKTEDNLMFPWDA